MHVLVHLGIHRHDWDGSLADTRRLIPPALLRWHTVTYHDADDGRYTYANPHDDAHIYANGDPFTYPHNNIDNITDPNSHAHTHHDSNT